MVFNLLVLLENLVLEEQGVQVFGQSRLIRVDFAVARNQGKKIGVVSVEQGVSFTRFSWKRKVTW